MNRFYLSGKPGAKDGDCVEKGEERGERGVVRNDGTGAVKGELKLRAGAKVVYFCVVEKQMLRVCIDNFFCVFPIYCSLGEWLCRAPR